MLRALFHLGVVLTNVSAMCYEYLYVDLPLPAKRMENFPLKGRSIYLTFWCWELQTFYHLVALLNDLYGTNAPTKSPPLLRRLKDLIFPVAFTFATYVTLVFWTIYYIDPAMLAPEDMLKIHTPLVNHIMHSTIFLFIIIESLLPHKKLPNRKTGLTIAYLIILIYTVWFFIILGITGAGVYPLYEYLNTPGRTMFVLAAVILTTVIYIISEKINNFVCSVGKQTLYTQNGSQIKNKGN